MSFRDVLSCNTSHQQCIAKVELKFATAHARDKKKAKDFCNKRESVCRSKTITDCGPVHEKALKLGADKCNEEAQVSIAHCQTQELIKIEAQQKQKCVHAFFTVPANATDTTIDWATAQSGCAKSCSSECKIPTMMSCVNKFDGGDPSKFCKDLWILMHWSNEIDPFTGHPIGLLSQHSRLSKMVMQEDGTVVDAATAAAAQRLHIAPK